jgi:hypothetical protein
MPQNPLPYGRGSETRSRLGNAGSPYSMRVVSPTPPQPSAAGSPYSMRCPAAVVL